MAESLIHPVVLSGGAGTRLWPLSRRLYPKQLLTYLRLTNRSLGLLMNFGQETFKQGVQRVVNNHTPSS